MDYKKIHDQIILMAKNRGAISGYFERHHVKPKSMGGNDAKSNIVKLTAREHYLVHWLLFKIYRTKEMCFAWYRMTHCKNGVDRYTSKTFEYAKKHRAIQVSKIFSGRKLSADHVSKLSGAKKGKTYGEIGRGCSPLKGRELSDSHKTNLGISGKGRRHSEETREKMRSAKIGENNHRFGKIVSEETKKKLSESIKAYRKNSPMTDETKKKLSEAMKKAKAKKQISAPANTP